MTLQAGDIVGRYVVEAHLGEGGMATVYKARHRELGSLHALKLMKAEQADHERLMREGQAQALARHHNIVTVTDVVRYDDTIGLVMELIEGPTLKEHLKHNRLSLEEVDRIAIQILGGVEAAHKAGLVHRDLKPSNILLVEARTGGWRKSPTLAS